MLLDREQFFEGLTAWAEDPPLTLVLGDIDAFAHYNETQGHGAGDIVLDFVQRTLKGSMPTGSYVARIGGDEFACALPGTTPEEALILLGEIRQHFVDRGPQGKRDIDDDKLSMRFGIAAYPQHVARVEDLHRAADDAMHRAKREGGGVAIYVEDRMTLKSNYYTKAQLARLTALADRLGKTEASLLREALADLLAKYRDK